MPFSCGSVIYRYCIINKLFNAKIAFSEGNISPGKALKSWYVFVLCNCSLSALYEDDPTKITLFTALKFTQGKNDQSQISMQ